MGRQERGAPSLMAGTSYTVPVAIPPNIQDLIAGKRLSLSLLVRSGSKAYGIDVEGSDDDYVGVFIPPLRDLLSIPGLERDTYAGGSPDTTIHEIGKFCRLGLKGNPAILETLWNPDSLACDRWGRRLVQSRKKFLHRGSLDVYVEYAESQLKKMVKCKGLHAKGGIYSGKFGAHLVRLLHAGIGLATTGEVTVRVPPDLSRTLLDIRSGARPMADVLDMARPLLERLKRHSKDNPLPERPDFEAIDGLVIEARLSRIDR